MQKVEPASSKKDVSFSPVLPRKDSFSLRTFCPKSQSGKFLLHAENHISYTTLAPQYFNGKEKDYESGFHYYGARYYWSEVLTGWLSVDPMGEEYPNISPYHYCHWNPIMIIDPDGCMDDWVESAEGIIYWDDNATSQETTKEGETYLGKNVLVGTHGRFASNFEGFHGTYYLRSKPSGSITPKCILK